jgi:hypothetical protein
MKNLWVGTVAPALLLLSGTASATDLKKIDRKIAREPAYTSKQPRYCLLVFGPQATTRVWLVADGDSLYIDRNGNGDLTEPGERVRFAAARAAGDGAFAEQREAEAGDLLEGKLKHERLVVTQQRVRKDFAAKERWEEELQAGTGKTGDLLVYHLSLTLEIRPRPGDPIRIAGRVGQYAGLDGAGFLQFAARPEEAPVVHFRGPLHMGLHSPQRLLLGADGGELLTVVGTPGLGKGTFASVAYGGLITAGAAPVAEIEFPSTSGSPLLKTRYTLPHRC